MRKVVLISVIVLPLLDLIWNLTHLNIGLVDFYGLAAFAQGCAVNGAWPATPYFPAGYSLLLIPGGLMGSVLIWGYCLSCLGHSIALWSIDRLIRLFGGSQGLALAAIIVAWLAPVYRIVAGSPSVDALCTGLGLWFMVAALAIWRGSQPATDLAPATVGLAQTGARLGSAVAELPRWAGMGLAVPAILLPVLRYHALVLLLPVLLVLFFWRRRSWQVVLTAAVAVVLAVGFNQVTYLSEYHQPQASATELQIRTGLEITQGGTYYESTEALFADYPAFCEHARSNSLLADYPVTSLLRHVGANWVSYLKRTPIVLAVLGVLLLLAIRRPGLAGLPLAAGWIACYTLTLSAAYYTPAPRSCPYCWESESLRRPGICWPPAGVCCAAPWACCC